MSDNKDRGRADDRPLASTVKGFRGPESTEPEAPWPSDRARAPERIGPYRILDTLGEGGMGVVFLAEQTAPVQRRVALKMLRGGFSSRELQIRFEAERQAMARLNQPNVARLYEAGATEDGQPYFVMELIQGVPITEYCDNHRLGIRQRVELFLAVCEGVQHAHEKGLLHRDLKPSNILVTDESGQPVPKVLDFGIAKATDQPLVDGTLQTGESVIGTPAYLSPEAVQSAGSTMDVDTRSDVYSLGITLYELLVGVRPFEHTDVPFLELLKRITDEEPTSPSVRWTELDEGSGTELAHARRLDSGAMAKRLRGDLDWIVLKAIAKDRRERYASAAGLAADLERFLHEQPVEAGPPTATYRLRKFLRRRRGVVAAAAIVLLSLVLGLTGTLLNLGRAQREAERANEQAEATRQALAETEEIAQFLQGLFEVSDPSEARGNTVTARELLDRGAETSRTELQDQPLTQARFLVTIGEVYENLGLYEEAGPLLEEALATRERVLVPDHLDVATAADALGRLRFEQARFEEADELFRRALTIREAKLDADHPDLAASLNHLAYLLTSQGRYEESEPLHRRGLAIQEKVLGPEHPDLVLGLTALGVLYFAQERHDEAGPVLRRALAIREQTLPPDHPDLASSLFNLANVLTAQGSHDEAEGMYRRFLEIQERVLGPEHPQYAMGLANLAWLYQEAGRFREAETPYRRALETFERVLGPNHPNNGLIHDGLGVVASALGRYTEAEASFRRAIELKEDALGPEHPEVAHIVGHLAQSYAAQDRHREAEDQFRRALSISESALGPDNPLVASFLEELAAVIAAAGRGEEANELYRRAVTIHAQQTPPDEETIARLEAAQAEL